MPSTILPIRDFDLNSIVTPCYLYDMELLDKTIRAIKDAAINPAFRIHYAMKANSSDKILDAVRDAGFGVDTVSGGEIKLALECGFKPEKIVFAGVGKTDAEIDLAINAGIGCFNVESVEELAVIASRAETSGKKAPVALRVNPNIDAHTHHYITTGLAENKFGIPMATLEQAIDMVMESAWLELKGLHFHIGSQITTPEPFVILCQRINGLQAEYEAKGISFASINVGGGLGIDYDNPDSNPIPDFNSFFRAINDNLAIRPGQEVHFELGRSVVGQCGTLLTKVLYVKKGLEKKFVIVDAGFTDLIRPALYGAHHTIHNITSHAPTVETYDVVGPVCESSDTFGHDESLPMTERGDILAIRSAGAYGSVMSMQYNCRRLPGAIYINR